MSELTLKELIERDILAVEAAQAKTISVVDWCQDTIEAGERVRGLYPSSSSERIYWNNLISFCKERKKKREAEKEKRHALLCSLKMLLADLDLDEHLETDRDNQAALAALLLERDPFGFHEETP